MRIETTLGMHAELPQSTECAIVSPHPDDAVLSCWLILTRPEVRRVVTVFAGLPAVGATASAWDRLTGCTDPRQRALERRAEDRRALLHSGCTPVHLEYVGAVHRHTPLDTKALQAVLAAAIADCDTVFAPAAIGGHPDHIAARDATLAVSAGRHRLLYADQPYAVRFGWPSWVTGQPASGDLDVDGWLATQLSAVLGAESASIRNAGVFRLPAASQSAKSRAIGEYRSQYAALAASAGADFPTGPRWAYEVIWQLS
jgi:LmbE family N-acetylglucosaminyl deacetylase